MITSALQQFYLCTLDTCGTACDATQLLLHIALSGSVFSQIHLGEITGNWTSYFKIQLNWHEWIL